MEHNKRKEQLLDAALHVATLEGYRKLTRNMVAAHAKVSSGLIQFHFHSMDKFKASIIKWAVELECLPVLVQVMGDPKDRPFLTPLLKDKVLEYMRETV